MRRKEDILAEQMLIIAAKVCGWVSYVLMSGLLLSVSILLQMKQPFFISVPINIAIVAIWGFVSFLILLMPGIEEHDGRP